MQGIGIEKKCGDEGIERLQLQRELQGYEFEMVKRHFKFLKKSIFQVFRAENRIFYRALLYLYRTTYDNF